ncbi:hypothetical protein JYU19_02450, partial [bacterium AH-315-J21]|nr:hypothetical protein [bacterium AH-315-J21]
LFIGDESGSYNSGDFKWPGFVGSVSVDLLRTVAIDLTLETLRLRQPSYRNPDKTSTTSVYLGVTTKDYAALGSTVVVAVVAVVILLSTDYTIVQ